MKAYSITRNRILYKNQSYVVLELSQGQKTIINTSDYDKIKNIRWFAYRSRTAKTFYVIGNLPRRDHPEGKQKGVKLHRFLFDLDDPKTTVDHKDGNGLNNIRENLRVCTQLQNSRNYPIPHNNTSGYKGVSWNKIRKKWQAKISVCGVRKSMGYYDDPKDAAIAYNHGALEYHNEFANLNVV